MNIKITSEEELAHKFRETVHILNNLRHFQKMWDESYGSELKVKKKAWEKKADEYLKKIGNPQIKIKS